jgi:hypothetical protein
MPAPPLESDPAIVSMGIFVIRGDSWRKEKGGEVYHGISVVSKPGIL